MKINTILKHVRELSHVNLILSSTDLYFSKIKELKERKIDFDVFLPTKGINLQREKVWTLLQKRELIMSILMERFIPNICTLSLIDYDDKKGGDIIQIIDGKQRLSAMIDFYDNEFTIILEGNEYHYIDLPTDYQSKIANYHIRHQTSYDDFNTKISDEVKIDWFKKINFFGTPQDVSHLEKISK